MRDLIIECDARRERVDALLTRQRYRSGRRLQHKGRRRVRIKRSDHIEQEIVQCRLLFVAVTRAECQSQIFRDLICRLPDDESGRAPWRERVWQEGEITGVAGQL